MRFFACDAALVMVEVESVDAGLRLQARALEAAFDGAAVARFQFHIGEQFESGRDAEISWRRLQRSSPPIWRLIAFRFSCCSFCSRGVIGFLSGFENEGVVFQQRDRVGGEFVEQRIAQPERRLRTSRRPLLAQDVGDVIGAESASRGGFFDSAGHIFRAVLPDQFQQFGI